MFSKFKFERVALSLIHLDVRNPRIVTPTPMATEEEIVRYLFEHESLREFLKKITIEGRNPGAERPYLIKSGKEYTVVEGNTRIAAYKLLTEQMPAPVGYEDAVPSVPKAVKDDLSSVDCSIAPNRDALMPIMAAAHFGLGDKSKWGYLGSRKAVFDEHQAGKSIHQLATVFDRKAAQIRDLLLDYELYRESLQFGWTAAELSALQDPAVEFNPPVRFLQSTGHKDSTGIDFDRPNLAVVFKDADAKAKLEHLVRKLVVHPGKGLTATSSYIEVFADYVSSAPIAGSTGAGGNAGGQAAGGTGSAAAGNSSGNSASASSSAGNAGGAGTQSGGSGQTGGTSKLPNGALFSYPLTKNSVLMAQLMKEAGTLNCIKFPAAGTALLRSIVEAVLKRIIDDQGANPQSKFLTLSPALDICLQNNVTLSPDDKSILKDFKKNHLNYMNLGTHTTVVPNTTRVMSARDCIDQFVRRNV